MEKCIGVRGRYGKVCWGEARYGKVCWGVGGGERKCGEVRWGVPRDVGRSVLGGVE